jgi:hypothetical protein
MWDRHVSVLISVLARGRPRGAGWNFSRVRWSNCAACDTNEPAVVPAAGSYERSTMKGRRVALVVVRTHRPLTE